jgi:hypothetical protein
MKPNTYTIQFQTKDGRWHDWKFCAAAKVASWKTESGAEKYVERLRKANPDKRYRVVFWPDIFVI